jgi:hypothetical protein
MRPSWVGTIGFLAIVYWGAKLLTGFKQSQFNFSPTFYGAAVWIVLIVAVLLAEFVSRKFRCYEEHWVVWVGPIMVAVGFYSFAHLFGIFGFENYGKVIGTVVGILVTVALILHNDRTESNARKERRSLESKYREAGLIDDDD